jgi:multimeric flavodoxin WrbA
MKITLLNGDHNPEGSDFSRFVSATAKAMEKDHQVQSFTLAQMNIKHCVGCWNCWVKTPGLCTQHDESSEIMREIIQSDLVIFASPILAGFTSSTLKKLQDRMIVLIHPYIALVKGECHHKIRYDRYPDFALLLQKEEDTDEDDINIITNIYERLAMNFHCSLQHTWIYSKHKLEDITYAINYNQRVTA